LKAEEIVEEMETGDRLPVTVKEMAEKESSEDLPVSRIEDPRRYRLLPEDSAGLNHPRFNKHPESSIEATEVPSEPPSRSPVSGYRLPLLLIVEDNPDVTSYICSFLEKEYRIITAINGKKGWKKALEKYPDLIISDVMMPEMDGFELCHKLKSDKNTSHIPIILLTAKADLNSKLDGLEFGADDYISKPFDAKEVNVRVKNLIEQREKLRKKFSRLIEIKPGEVATSSMDDQFLQRLLTVFEKHLSESGYSTENFAREVGMSRSQLNRKLRAMTDLSTHGFILNFRLKRAAQLLKKSTGSVSEIAYTVGFESPANFSKAFKNQFGQSPRDFAKGIKNL
jgi:YesN/AraC family two-component response regulator